MSRRFKCSCCGALSEHINTYYDYQERDYSFCPRCGTVEPGFTEIEYQEADDEQKA